MAQNIILTDLDNTLANMDHRLHLISGAHADWDQFEYESVYDQPIEPTIRTMQAYKSLGLQVWVWTGRSDLVKKETENWLRIYGVPYEQLIMRPHGETMDTLKLKLGWLKSPIPQARVLAAYDDDSRIVKGLLEAGLHVFHVRKEIDDAS